MHITFQTVHQFFHIFRASDQTMKGIFTYLPRNNIQKINCLYVDDIQITLKGYHLTDSFTVVVTTEFTACRSRIEEQHTPITNCSSTFLTNPLLS